MPAKTNYFFLHLPKCAGSSLFSLLSAQSSLLHATTSVHMRMRAEVFFQSWTGVGGHFPLRDAYRLGFGGAWKFTFLRDPFERLVSHLIFAALRPQPPVDLDFVRPTVADIKEHLRRDLRCAFTTYHNCYCNFLSTTPDERAPMTEQIESAIANLHTFDFVGDQRSFAADVGTLCQRLGLTIPAVLPRENVSGGSERARVLREEMLSDAECCALLAECTQADEAVYRAASVCRPEYVPTTRFAAPVPVSPCCVQMGNDSPVRIMECALQPAGPVVPGTGLTLEVLLEIFHADFPFALLLTLEGVPAQAPLVQIYTFNHFGAHRAFPPGLRTFRFQLPCQFNVGNYRGHVAVLAATREAVAEKIDAFALVVTTQDLPGQFGSLYLSADISTRDISATRRLALAEARQLALCLDPRRPFTRGEAQLEVPLRLSNNSTQEISSDWDSRIFVSYHLLDEKGDCLLFEGRRHRIPRLGAGAEHFFVLQIPPGPAAAAVVQIRLLQEMVRWHEGPDFAGNLIPDLEFLPVPSGTAEAKTV